MRRIFNTQLRNHRGTMSNLRSYIPRISLVLQRKARWSNASFSVRIGGPLFVPLVITGRYLKLICTPDTRLASSMNHTLASPCRRRTVTRAGSAALMTAAALCFAPMALAATQTYVADTVSSSPSSASCGFPTISVADTGEGFTWVDTLPPAATVTAVRLELDVNCLDDAGLGTVLNGVPGGSVPRLDAGACDCG